MKLNATATTVSRETHTDLTRLPGYFTTLRYFTENSRVKCLAQILAIVAPMVLTTSAHALLSEPQNIFYGNVIVNNQPLTLSDTGYTVLAKLNGVILDSFTMGANTTPQSDKYIIRVPIDSLGARSPNFARTGDSLEFYLSSIEGETLLATATVGERGQITALQLGVVESDVINSDIASCCEGAALSSSSTVNVNSSSTQSLLRLSGDSSTEQGLNVSTASEPIRTGITAWIGSVDTQVNFAPGLEGAAFYRSREVDCDLANYTLCEDGQMDIVNSQMVIDSAATLAQAGYYVLQQGGNSASLTVDAQAFAMAHTGQQMMSFNEQLWLIGGDELWSSTDGIRWTKHQFIGSEFAAREGSSVVHFDNRLWLIGGENSTGFTNDVWSSEDGLNWIQQTAGAAFTPRTNHKLVSFNNQLWLFGGSDESGDKYDIWSSSDGVTWIEQTVNPALIARDGFQIASFANQLWLIGGAETGTYKNDIWSTQDGFSWTQHTTSAAFSARADHQLISFANQLWLVGGVDESGYKNDVWSSADGLNWTEHTSGSRFSPRARHRVVSFNNQLLLVGGDNGEQQNDIWSSSDGELWRKGFYGIFNF